MRCPRQFALADTHDFTQPAQAEADPASRIGAITRFLYTRMNILICWHSTGLSWMSP